MARMRGNVPSFFCLIIVICGELFGESLVLLCNHGAPVLISGLVLFLISIFLHAEKRWITAFLALGLVSSALAMGIAPRTSSTETIRTLIQIDSTPSKARFNEIEFRAGLLPGASRQRSAVWCTAIELPWLNIEGAQRGDRFQALLQITPLRLDLNPFSRERALAREGISARCKILASGASLKAENLSLVEAVRRKIIFYAYEQLGREESTGLLLSVTLGGEFLLGGATREAFRDTGLAHVLVVSGYQVSLLVMWIYFLMYKAAARAAALSHLSLIHDAVRFLSVAVGFFYVGLTGFEDAGLRAFVASASVFAASLLGQTTRCLEACCASLVLLLILWPGCIFEASTQLTYAALLGIYVGGAAADTLPRSRILAYMSPVIWATLFASLVSSFWFKEVNALSVPCNILLAPLISFFGTLWGLCGFLLSMMSEDFGRAVLMGSREILWLLRGIIAELSIFSEASRITTPWAQFIFGMLCVREIMILLVQWIRSQGSALRGQR